MKHFKLDAVAFVLAAMCSGAMAVAQETSRNDGRNGEREKTVKNLREAFEDESEAAQKYELFARRAIEENQIEVAKAFRAAAKSETIHRDRQSQLIRDLGGEVPRAEAEDIEVKSTRENLEETIKDEKKDGRDTYPEFIRQAKRAGEEGARRTFEDARATEEGHVKIFELLHKKPSGTKPMDYYVNRESGVITVVPEGQPFPEAERFWKVN